MDKGLDSPISIGSVVEKFGSFVGWVKEIGYKNGNDDFDGMPTQFSDLEPSDFNTSKLSKWKITDNT